MGPFEIVVRVRLYSQKMSESFRQGFDVLGLTFLENRLVSVWRTDFVWDRRGIKGTRQEAVSPGWVRGWVFGLQ